MSLLCFVRKGTGPRPWLQDSTLEVILACCLYVTEHFDREEWLLSIISSGDVQQLKHFMEEAGPTSKCRLGWFVSVSLGLVGQEEESHKSMRTSIRPPK